ncbi:hypothetical protein F5887DRAFT_923824, partial [Amanita rubescens]
SPDNADPPSQLTNPHDTQGTATLVSIAYGVPPLHQGQTPRAAPNSYRKRRFGDIQLFKRSVSNASVHWHAVVAATNDLVTAMTTVSPAFEHLVELTEQDYDGSGPADDGDGYRMTSAIPSADSDGVAANLPGDASTSSTPAPLTRIQKRKLRYKLYRADKRRKEREMKLAANAMSGAPSDSDPNRMTNDGPGVTARVQPPLSSHASTDPSSIPPNTGMKRRLSSSSPRAAKRQKEAAKSATFDGPVTDSGPNHTTSMPLVPTGIAQPPPFHPYINPPILHLINAGGGREHNAWRSPHEFQFGP